MPEPDADGPPLRLTVDLQRDFALNQPLSPFALAALELLDPESETYALDVVSVIEATLEDPRQVLMAQQFRARGEAVAAMKAEGIEYDERMELLEEVTWPKPLAELLEPAYDIYRRGHPWVAEHRAVAEVGGPRPVRAGDDVRRVRRASTGWRARRDWCCATWPTPTGRCGGPCPRRRAPRSSIDLTEWLGELVRQVDSSLLDEWEQLTNPGAETDTDALAFEAPLRAISANERAFRVLVRNAMFRRVELVSRRDWAGLEALGAGPDAQGWADAFEPYFAEYGTVGMGPNARGPQLFSVHAAASTWTVRQILDDPAGDHGWALVGSVDVGESDEAGEIVFDSVEVVAG